MDTMDFIHFEAVHAGRIQWLLFEKVNQLPSTTCAASL